MGNREFDNYIKKQLDNIHTPFQPDDWDSMESLLDQQNMMADGKFDQFIKTGLAASTSEHLNSDWSSMEQLLNQDAIMADENLDQLVKNGLEQIAPAYQSSEWSGMENVLNKKEKERKELVYIKGIELILVMLAALTLYMFIPSNNPQIQGNPFNDANHPVISSTDIVENEIKDENVDHQITNDAESTIANLETIKISNSPKIESIKTPNYNTISTIIDSNDSNNEMAILNSPSLSENSPTKNLTVLPTNIEVKETVPTTEQETIDQAKVVFTETHQESVLALDAIPTLNDVDISLDQADFKMAIHKIKPTIRMSYQVGLDRNHIMTPYDSDTESSFKQGNYGFSAGVKTSVRKGRWEFETGLAYIKKQYNPSPIYQITGNSREGYQAETLKKLNFNMISVPLDLRFYLRRMPNKWNFYITSGAAFNTVAWSNYDRYTYTIEDASNPEDFTDGRAPRLREVQNAGIFNGESFRDNYYITASLGFGAEVNLDERVSFFTQPKFTYYLTPGNIGLGPNNDHFNTISVDLGLRFKL